MFVILTTHLLNFLNENSGAVQGLATVFLVLVTIYYAFQTRRLVIQNTMSQINDMRPILIILGFTVNQSDGQDHMCIEANIKNIGNGPALNIDINFFDLDSGSFIASSDHYLDFIEKGISDELPHIHIPKKDFESLRYKEEEGKLIVDLRGTITFSDFKGNVHQITQDLVFLKDEMKIEPLIGSFEMFQDSKIRNIF